MAKVIMVQGTMSSVGKSLIVAGLCRVFKQDGYKVCPFKSQNMALNSYITEDGLEMGRAQVMQAEAAGIKPDVCMNPILLKPTSDVGSQVIVNGEVLGNMKAKEYFKYKKTLVPEIMKAFNKLNDEYDIIVIEGAGSPAEINLKENDIVNMGMAKLADAPVILVGDIDRGGVFAQLLGTLMLLEEDERARVKGLVINKFRGDKSILDPGIEMLYEKCKVDVVGVLPYMKLNLEDEDSLAERFEKSDKVNKNEVEEDENRIEIAVVRLPHISNFSDFNIFEQSDLISLRYVENAAALGKPDMVILPGSKNTISDMLWLREKGFEASIKKLSEEETVIWGICGGYQMLGCSISDDDGYEESGSIKGMELLPVDTSISKNKTRKQIKGKIGKTGGIFEAISDKEFEGYEIHMGVSRIKDIFDEKIVSGQNESDVVVQRGNVYGTYVHGIFDSKEIVSTIMRILASKKGIIPDERIDKIKSYKEIKEEDFNKLADTVREYMNIDKIYSMLK